MKWPARLPVVSPDLNSVMRRSCQQSSNATKTLKRPSNGMSNAMAARQQSSFPHVAAKTNLNSKNSIGRGFSAN